MMQPVTSRRRGIALLAVMVVVAVAVGALTLFLLYRTSLDQQRERLIDITRSRVALLRAIATHELTHDGATRTDQILHLLREAQLLSPGLGRTGEFTLARSEDDEIVFLLQHRHHGPGDHTWIPMSSSSLAEPMRRALGGHSGTMTGLDYRGEQVLAAFEPVPEIGLGVVAKIDIAEVRAPFIRAGLLAGACCLVLTLLGALAFLRVGGVVIQHLDESEEKYRLAVESTTDGLWDWRLDADEVFYSPGWAAILGEDTVAPEYAAWESRLHPEDREPALASLHQHLRGATSHWQLEHRLRGADGQWRWVLGRGRVVARDSNGRALRMVGTMTDISHRKRAEQALRESEERFRTLTSLSPVGIYLTDTEGDCIYVNERWQEMAGMTLAQARGKGWIDGLHPDDRRTISEQWYRSVASGGSWAFEYRFLTGDTTTWVFGKARPLVDDNGTLTGYMGVNIDITRRKLAEEALRRERDLSQSLVDMAQVMILMLDTEGCIVSCNPYLEEISGHDRQTVVGKSWIESFLPAADQEAGREQLRQALNGSPSRGVISRIRTRDGNIRQIECYDKVLHSRDGEVSGLLVVGQDVTERLALEERLRQTEKMDAIGQLAGGIAHDFNNQLGVIIGFTDLLLDELHDPERRELATSIMQAATRSSHLTRELLTFARKVKQRQDPVDLHTTINDVVGLLRRTIERKITVSARLDAEQSVVIGDPVLLETALLNLALNARDAMPDGGEIVISTTRTGLANLPDPAINHAISVVVADTGSGIDEATQEHVFEPFFTTKETGKGTGMGLAMVYCTITSHGGTVQLVSQPGAGTEVRLTLPLAEATVQEEPVAGVPEDPLPPVHILVAEDEELLRAMLTDVLRSLGHQVTALADGEDAINSFREQWRSIDLVILDVDMPRLDGRDALQAMRRLNPSVKALLSSGHGAEQRLDRHLDRRTGFLAKPYRITGLKQALAKILR